MPLALVALAAAAASTASSAGAFSPAPDIKGPDETLGKALRGYFGGFAAGKSRVLQRLEAIPEQDRTPEQVANITRLRKQSHSDYSFADQYLNRSNGVLPQFDKIVLDRIRAAAPNLMQQQVDLYKQFGPQLAGDAFKSQQAMSPQFFEQRSQLGQNLQGSIGQGLTPEQTQYFRNQLMAGQANRGLMDSPLGSQQEALALAQLNMHQYQQNLANNMNFLNTYQLPQPYPVPSLGVENTLNVLGPDLTRPPSFADVVGMQSSDSAARTASGLYQSQQLNSGIQGGANALGSLAGLFGGMGGGGLGGTNGGLIGGSIPQFNPGMSAYGEW